MVLTKRRLLKHDFPVHGNLKKIAIPETPVLKNGFVTPWANTE